MVASAGGARLRPAGDGLLVGSGYQLPVPPAAAFCGLALWWLEHPDTPQTVLVASMLQVGRGILSVP